MAVAASATHEHWSSRAAFIFAAVGSAVGLGNIWKFPYEAGQGGGGAFVLIYLVFVFGIGVPVMIAELSLGRRGQMSPPNSVKKVAIDEGRSPAWQAIGWFGVIGAFLVLSFYSVIAGFALSYMTNTFLGNLSVLDGQASASHFGALTGNFWLVLFWHALFISLTIFVVARGVTKGLEKAVTWLMPALFCLLVFLVVYSLIFGAGAEAVRFLFEPDFSKVTGRVVLEALGQAFFSLSLALGTMLIYGCYLPRDISIPRSALVVASADTGVALLAGLAIFPIVFAYGLEAGQGPGLVFVTLPIAFAQMPGGVIIGGMFFLLLSIAALTSSISLLEPMVSWLEEHKAVDRLKSAILGGGLVFMVGLGSVLSFNHWSDITLFGRTFLGNLDFLTNNIIMPVGGFLIVVFVGWRVSRASMRDELHTISDRQFNIWRAMARYVCPLALLAIFYSVLS